MKRFLSFIHKTLFLLAVATISVAFEGCSEVADKTIDGIKDLPAQIIQMALLRLSSRWVRRKT